MFCDIMNFPALRYVTYGGKLLRSPTYGLVNHEDTQNSLFLVFKMRKINAEKTLVISPEMASIYNFVL